MKNKSRAKSTRPSTKPQLKQQENSRKSKSQAKQNNKGAQNRKQAKQSTKLSVQPGKKDKNSQNNLQKKSINRKRNYHQYKEELSSTKSNLSSARKSTKAKKPKLTSQPHQPQKKELKKSQTEKSKQSAKTELNLQKLRPVEEESKELLGQIKWRKGQKLNQVFGFNSEKEETAKDTKSTTANNKSNNSKKSRKKEAEAPVEEDSDDDEKFKQLNDIRKKFRKQAQGLQQPVQLAVLEKDPLEMSLSFLGKSSPKRASEDDKLVERVTKVEFDNFIFGTALLNEQDQERTKFLLARKMFIGQMLGKSELLRDLEKVNKSP